MTLGDVFALSFDSISHLAVKFVSDKTVMCNDNATLMRSRRQWQLSISAIDITSIVFICLSLLCILLDHNLILIHIIYWGGSSNVAATIRKNLIRFQSFSFVANNSNSFILFFLNLFA